MKFAPSTGHEFNGQRPAVVIQSDKQLAKSNLATVMAITSKTNKAHSDDIFIGKNKENRLFYDSLIKVHNIESFDYCRFINMIGKMSKSDLQKIKKYLKTHFDI